VPLESRHCVPLNLSRLWSWARRDIRSGALSLMAASVLVSVAAVSAVSLLAARVEQALLRDAQSSLGADRLLVSDRPTPSDWIQAVEANGLRTVKGVQFPSMVVAGERSALVALKAIESGYPMRGRLEVQTAEGLQVNPVLGERRALVDPALLARLGLRIGDTISIGNAKFEIAGRILYEPDRGMNFVNLSPRVLLRIQDIATAGLLVEGSRASYRLWVSGPTESLRNFDRAIEPLIGAGQRIETLENARPELKEALNRANGFLSLTAMVAMLTGCAAMALAARRLSVTYAPRLAVMKALGTSRRELQWYWALALLAMVLASSTAGLLIGWGLQAGLASLLQGLLTVSLPPLPTQWLTPVAQSFGLALVMTAVFAWPVVLSTTRVSALTALRGLDASGSLRGNAKGPFSWRAIVSRLPFIALLWVGLGLLLWLGASDLRLAAIVAIGFGLFGLLSAGLLWLLFRAMGRALSLGAQRGWAMGSLSRALRRRTWGMVVQVLGLGTALSALFLLAFVRGDLVAAWDRSMPIDAPNRFVINIIPGEERDVGRLIESAAVQNNTMAPMVRGRLIAINERAVFPESYQDERAQRLVDRELNLSYASAVPAHNKIVAGRPLDPKAAEVSVELGIARTLGISMDDQLSFDISGELVKARVTSIRSLRWDSMSVNFFMILSPAVLSELPQTFIAAFYVPKQNAEPLEAGLLGRFPSLTVIDLETILNQVRRILTQVVTAVQALFGFSLVAGALVLWAALVATRDERMKEAVLLRALGASKGQLIRAQVFELLAVGGIAGLASAVLAQLIGWVVADQVFQLPVAFNFMAMLGGLGLGAIICLLAGMWALRPVFQRSPVEALRSRA